MKKPFLKQLFVLLLAPAFLLSFTLKPDHTNFSGDWKLNEGKSDLGQFASYATRSIKTVQDNDSISIARTAPSMNGDDFTSHETLTFDGKETESPLFGESKKIASAKWADDGQSFTITYKLMLDFNGQQNEIEGTEKWSLADGGKTLVLENNSSSSFGDLSTKAVYDKQ
ncbi:MAG TPA: hypothetical protein VHD35_17085 [Chitinophagaceae bacterium]|nr:hypothetical protein [Chitinophagaceae bacterium]